MCHSCWDPEIPCLVKFRDFGKENARPPHWISRHGERPDSTSEWNIYSWLKSRLRLEGLRKRIFGNVCMLVCTTAGNTLQVDVCEADVKRVY